MNLETSYCSIGAVSGAPDWIHLLPLGEIKAVDGRAWRNIDPQAVVNATRAIGRDLPIDYDHATDIGKTTGAPAPAAGWITAVEARADGIWGKASWTERGRAALAAREWRFISPVFLFDKATGVIRSILRAALTNDPAIAELTALAHAMRAEARAQLSPMELEVCTRMGLDEAAYLRTKGGR